MLKPAWNLGMIERPRRCSTNVPSTFMATSQVPLPTPNRKSPTTTGGDADAVAERRHRETAAVTMAMTVIVRAAPSRATTVPGERQGDQRAGRDRQQQEAEARRD